MRRLHPFYFVVRNERERVEFLEAGIELPQGKLMESGGEFISLDIADDDPRFENLCRIFRKRLEQKAAELKASSDIESQPKLSNSSQTVEDILGFEGKSRPDSLVGAFEEAIRQKAERNDKKSLTDTERVVLAVEALEREVNNGGYDQFFTNSSREFALVIVDSLRRIGCNKAASITERAVKALGVSDLTMAAIDEAMAVDDEQRLKKFTRCDEAYYKNTEPITDRLFAFIKTNKSEIRL